MRRLSVALPVGLVTLIEDGGKITGLRWGPGRASEETLLLRQARQQLEAYFKGRRQTFDLPLAPAGTPFQKAVWRAMSQIPYGKTRSYGELARQLKSGPRAVGGACARNPIPILIPCHRVLGAHGALGGYSARGGVTTKRRLLALEGAQPRRPAARAGHAPVTRRREQDILGRKAGDRKAPLKRPVLPGGNHA